MRPRKHLLNAADKWLAECLPWGWSGMLSIFRRSVKGGMRGTVEPENPIYLAFY